MNRARLVLAAVDVVELVVQRPNPARNGDHLRDARERVVSREAELVREVRGDLMGTGQERPARLLPRGVTGPPAENRARPEHRHEPRRDECNDHLAVVVVRRRLRRRRLERALLPEDPRMQLLEREPGLEPELID